MGLGPVHFIVLAIVAILLLGGGRFSNMMGDVAKGVKNFKKGMSEDDDPKPVSRLETKPVPEPVVERDVERTGKEL
jgi:sec-independent protein translocase protein TatA